jgi:hypothetical protein
MGRDDDAAAPADCLTLVMPLQARAGMTNRDFYEYWLNAHVTLPARFPGISSIFLHCVSFDDADADANDGAGVSGAGHLAAPARRQPPPATQTVSDQTELKATDGHDGLVRHLLFLCRREDVPINQFRSFVAETLAPALAASPDVLKVRRHLFEEVEVTLDHPGVRMSRPLNRQYQAALEVVSADLDRFKASTHWEQLAEPITAHCEAVHAARVSRCITTKYQGTITLAGVRGVAVADVIRRLGADSQLDDEVSALFLHTPTRVLTQPSEGDFHLVRVAARHRPARR